MDPVELTQIVENSVTLLLALGIEEGADAQAPLARVVIGGLTASTLITLVLVPVVYAIFHPTRKPSGLRSPLP